MIKTKRVTVKQVAEHAGVSPMTVSNYINGRFDLMTSKMRSRVGKSVKELNYRRNNGAYTLRTAQAWSIGIIVVDRSDHYLSDGYTTQIISGFTNALSKKGYSVMLQGIPPEKFQTSNMLQNIQTDATAVLLSGCEQDRLAQYESIRKLDAPTIVFLENIGQGDEKTCVIMQDELAGVRSLTERVTRQPKQHVVILTSGLNEWAAVNERIRGMRDMLSVAGVENVQVVQCGDCSVTDVQKALKSYIFSADLPDAVMCINDTIALIVLDYFHQTSVSVPEQVKVTGYNAFGLHVLSRPHLTTIESPAYKMGEIGARELLDCLEHGAFKRPVITCPTRLIKGGSA